MRAKLLQSCPTLCDLMDCSLPGSSVHGILQARILERVAIPFSRGSSQPRDWTHVLLWLLHCRQILHCWATGEAKKKSWSKFIRNCVCLRIRTEDAPSAFWSLRPRKEVSWERKMFSEKWESEYCYFIVWISSPCAWVTRLIQTLNERIPVEGQPLSSAGDAETGRVTARKEFTV